MNKANSFLRKALKAFCALLMAVMTIVVLWGVITRYALGKQAVFTDELACALLVCLTFFGGALAFAQKAHVGIEVLYDFFTPDAKKISKFTATLISLIFVFVVLIIGGILLVSSSIASANKLTTLPIYMWQIYLCVPISGIFATMFLLEDLLILKREESL